MRTILVTGVASGIGLATRERLERDGARVIGADLREAEILTDLGSAEGRAAMVAAVREQTPSLDGVVACAGVDLLDPLTVRVNYFGAVATVEGVRELLVRSAAPRAVVVASQASLQPYVDAAIVDACLAGDESAAVAAAERRSHGRPAASGLRVVEARALPLGQARGAARALGRSGNPSQRRRARDHRDADDEALPR